MIRSIAALLNMMSNWKSFLGFGPSLRGRSNASHHLYLGAVLGVLSGIYIFDDYFKAKFSPAQIEIDKAVSRGKFDGK